MSERAPRVAVGLGLAALVAWSFAGRWRILGASPFPLGVDGYFYPIQLRSLLETGTLAYPASPLGFYLMAPFAAATDPIVGAKLAAALYGALIALPAYALGARLGGSRGAGLLAAAIAATSVGSTYLSIEFVKNGIGLTVALAALWLVMRAIEDPRPRRVVPAMLAVLAAYATHKMAAGLVVAVAVPAAIAGAAARGRLRGRRLLYLMGIVAGVAVLAIVVGVVFPERFLAARDAALVRDLFALDLHWSAPALAWPGGELQLGYEAFAALLVGLAAIGARWLPGERAAVPREAGYVGWAIVAIAIAIGLPMLAVTDRDGLGFRLRIAAFVPLALAAAVLFRHTLGRLAHRDLAAAVLAAAIALVRQPSTPLPGQIATHPALVTSALALAGHVPPGATLIVPERHIAFLVAWYARAPVALQPERVPRDRRWRLLPLDFIGEGSRLDRALLDARDQTLLVPPLGLHPGAPNGLVLVAEPTWDWALTRLPARDRAYFAGWPTI